MNSRQTLGSVINFEHLYLKFGSFSCKGQLIINGLQTCAFILCLCYMLSVQIEVRRILFCFCQLPTFIDGISVHFFQFCYKCLEQIRSPQKHIYKNQMKQQIVPTPQDFRSLPTVGIHAMPSTWRDEKAIRDTQLSKENTNKLWIVEGKLYDLQQYMKVHPGGQSWMRNTQGHDITELFITHHLNEDKARSMLNKYYVKDCKRKIERFTFQKQGLYRTVKSRLLQKFTIQQIQRETQSKKQAWIIFSIFIVFLTLAAYNSSYIYAAISGVMIMGIFGVMHNFLHHKQNKYSSFIKLTGFSFDDFQIMHCISHHVYVNTELDFEVTGMQPLGYWLRSKPKNKLYTQWIIQPILALASPMNIIMNLTVFPLKNLRKPHPDYFYPLLVGLYIFLFNGDVLMSVKLWFFIYFFYSFFFFKVLLCQHRMPELWTQGNPKIWDFGQHTLASTSDVNSKITGILSFVLLAGFNLHSIHHFFPTADHSILPKINQVLVQVCKQRKIRYHSMGRLECSLKFTKGMTSRQPFDFNQG